jgi:hypothetical protein
MMTRQRKQYEFDGSDGCVEKRRRKNGSVVGVYSAEQSGLDNDPSVPWFTVCETHGRCVGHPTLRLAKEHAVVPWNWCEVCEPPRS